eukprot:3630856-Pyramimonas_sp.AAC.1
MAPILALELLLLILQGLEVVSSVPACPGHDGGHFRATPPVQPEPVPARAAWPSPAYIAQRQQNPG